MPGNDPTLNARHTDRRHKTALNLSFQGQTARPGDRAVDLPPALVSLRSSAASKSLDQARIDQQPIEPPRLRPAGAEIEQAATTLEDFLLLTAAQTRVVSMAGIRLGSWESARAFKGIICDDVSEFESHMPSQPVWSLRLFAGGSPGIAEKRRDVGVSPAPVEISACHPLSAAEQIWRPRR